MKTLATVSLILLSSLILLACANPAIRDAQKLAMSGQHEQALLLLQDAQRLDPDNIKLRSDYLKERDIVVTQAIAAASSAWRAGRKAEYEEAIAHAQTLAPGNPRVSSLRREVERHAHIDQQWKLARDAFENKQFERSESLARALLSEQPGHAQARALLLKSADQRDAATQRGAPPTLSAKPVSLEFRDTPLRNVFEAMARAANLNFVFDKDVRGDSKITIFLRNVSVDEALRVLLNAQQLERKFLNDNSLLIYPATQAKQREHLETATRTFYLTNIEPKQVQQMLKAITKSRDMYIDERLNLLVVRDTPDALRLIERLIETVDLPEPEVMLDVEVLEVASSRVDELGLKWPEAVSYGVPGLKGDITRSSNLRAYIPNPLAVAHLHGTTDAANLLASPRIRARNREKAKVHIGEKLPVFTTTSTANVGVSSSVSYLDVGLKLDIEPQVQLDDEVIIKIGLEVSNVIGQVKGPQDAVAYNLGTRVTTTSLRLRDGETQVLAGLINDEDRRGGDGLPGLNGLPIVGALFGVQTDERRKTEIVMLITPHIVRNLVLPSSAMSNLAAGTEAQAGAPALRLRAGSSLHLAASTGTRAGGAVGLPTSPKDSATDSTAQVELSLPDEVEAGSSVAVGVTNRGTATLKAELSYDSALLDSAEASTPGLVAIELPPGASRTVSLQIHAMQGAGVANFQIAGVSQQLKIRAKPVPKP